MKMKRKSWYRIKRQISVILTLTMLLTMIPTTGFAVEPGGYPDRGESKSI